MNKFVFFVIVTSLLSGCATRSLTKNEIANLENEYAEHLPYEEVEVIKKNVAETDEFQKAVARILKEYPESKNRAEQIKARPFVINNTIFYPKKDYAADFSDYIAEERDAWAEFVHENCHVLAYKLGLRSAKHNGKAYNWTLGLKEQLTIKDPYKKPKPEDIKQTDKLEDFGFEQQCDFFKDWALYAHTDYVLPYGKMIESALAKYDAPRINSYVFSYKGGFRKLASIVEEGAKKSRELGDGGGSTVCRVKPRVHIDKIQYNGNERKFLIDTKTPDWIYNPNVCVQTFGYIKGQLNLIYSGNDTYSLSAKVKIPYNNRHSFPWVPLYDRSKWREARVIETIKALILNDKGSPLLN